ncbi:hypothetical protein FBY36_1433 [Arthrobacter sp. SLBN-122]|nr:hypothetical protein FBY36_1433 [Arthrobacter sp. SLBN-122]
MFGAAEAVMPEKELFWIVTPTGQCRIIEFHEFDVYMQQARWEARQRSPNTA